MYKPQEMKPLKVVKGDILDTFKSFSVRGHLLPQSLPGPVYLERMSKEMNCVNFSTLQVPQRG